MIKKCDIIFCTYFILLYSHQIKPIIIKFYNSYHKNIQKNYSPTCSLSSNLNLFFKKKKLRFCYLQIYYVKSCLLPYTSILQHLGTKKIIHSQHSNKFIKNPKHHATKSPATNKQPKKTTSPNKKNTT